MKTIEPTHMTFDDLTKWLIDYVAAYPEKYNEIAI